MHFPKNSERGFTLIETFVAITILLVAIGSPLTLAYRGFSSSNVARDQVSAFYLAQDAVETVRNIRDQNGLNGQPWLTNLSACVGQTCLVDARNNSATVCGATCEPIRYDSVSHFYGYESSWSPSPFTRTVELTSLNENEAKLSVIVSWQSGSITRSFTVREHMHNWQ